MPVTPKEQKRFLELLYAKRQLPLAEAGQVFVNRNGNLNTRAIEETLRFLWLDDLFDIIHVASDESVLIDASLFDSPQDYVIRFNGFEGKENNFSSEYACTIDPADVNELEKHHYWVGVKAQEIVRVTGEIEGATVLAERIRAFTHFLAFNLVSGNDDVVAPLFSEKISEKQSLAAIRAEIARLEKEFGKFDHFDHVRVITVYNGKNRDAKVDDQMPVPRGVSRSARRGQSSFDLISVHTPNGISVHEYMVDLYIIEEDGVFRVSGSHLFSGF